jgi:hypothetical protein
VTDTSGRPVREAGLELASMPPGANVTLIGYGSDRRGAYRDPNLSEPGAYGVMAVAPGYEPLRARLEIRRGYTTVADFVLEPIPGYTPTAVPTPLAFGCQRALQPAPREGDGAPSLPGGSGVRGCVRDASGEKFLVAYVYLSGDRGAGINAEPSGRYWLRGLPPGEHVLVAYNPYYGEDRRRVVVRPGRTAVLDFALEREDRGSAP